jgi:probable F420-dependent oxidoreductase
VRFSLWLWPYGRWGGIEAMGDAAELAERLGFANVSVSDHTICTTGPEAEGVTHVWPDWSVLSTYLAMRTSRMRILTSLVVPYRPVLPTAKQIATVDVVSGGRFTLAAAVGWLEPEFRMLNVPHAERGPITDEYLRAMKVLWTEDEPSFSGKYVSFAGIVFEPKCLQKPHVPIWIAGGTAPAPLRRVVEIGDGWMPMGGDLDTELRGAVARLKERAAEVGRDPEALTFRYTIGIGRAEAALEKISKSISVADPSTVGLGGSPQEVVEAVRRFEEAGFTELAINFAGESAPELMEQLEWFGGEVMPLLSSQPARA